MSSTQSNKNSFGRWVLKAVLLLFVAGMMGGFAYNVYTKENPALVRIEPKSLCRADRPLVSSTAIIVDGTDPLTDTQIARARARIHEVRDSAPVGGKVIVLLVDPATPFEPYELIARCNPGSGKDASRISENLFDAENRWREAFEGPLDEVINNFKKVPMSQRSPIIESIVGATQRPDFDRSVPNRSLVVISDGLQNDGSRDYTHYVTNTDLSQAYARSRHALEPQADLEDTNVVFEYLTRPSAAQFQGPQHRAFWRRWLTENRAASVHFLGVRDDSDRRTVVTGLPIPKENKPHPFRTDSRSIPVPPLKPKGAGYTLTKITPN